MNKKLLLFCALFILLISCGILTSPDSENPSSEIPPVNQPTQQKDTLEPSSTPIVESSPISECGDEIQEQIWDGDYSMMIPGANLSGCDLSRTNLSELDLTGADLRFTDLQSADLRKSDLSGANLQGANLYGAQLDGTIFSDANLSGAILHVSSYDVADYTNADLSEAILIARCVHPTWNSESETLLVTDVTQP